jgi:hypothetical protein
MNRFLLPFALLVLALGFESCEDKDQLTDPGSGDNPNSGLSASSVTLKFDALWDTVPFQMGRIFTDAYGNRVRADLFKNYISRVTLFEQDGDSVLLKDFMLADYSANNEVIVPVPNGRYTSLKLGVGIPAEYNTDQDPANYPNSSPLSVAGSQGMFWQWSTGYIFAKFEGKADTSGVNTTPLLLNIAIHAGNDASYRAFNSEPFILDLNNMNKTVSVHLNVQKLFSPDEGSEVNLTNNAVTHSQNNSQLARDYMDNLVAALWVEL